jgi:hypothetical protein
VKLGADVLDFQFQLLGYGAVGFIDAGQMRALLPAQITGLFTAGQGIAQLTGPGSWSEATSWSPSGWWPFSC